MLIYIVQKRVYERTLMKIQILLDICNLYAEKYNFILKKVNAMLDNIMYANLIAFSIATFN